MDFKIAFLIGKDKKKFRQNFDEFFAGICRKNKVKLTRKFREKKMADFLRFLKWYFCSEVAVCGS